MKSTLSSTSWGDNKLPPLLCLHGLMGSKEDFNELCTLLSAHFYCIAIDLPGFGKSPISLSENPWDDLIREILSFIEEQALSHLSLLGYSLGGRIALYLIEKMKEVNHVFILSSRLSLSDQEKEAQQKKGLYWIESLSTLSDEMFLQKWYRQPLFSTLEEKNLLPVLMKKRRPLNKEAISYYLQKLSPLLQPSPHKTLSGLKKGLFLFGEKDQNYAEHYQKHQEDYPHLDFSSIEKSSHALLEENPEQIASTIINFLGAHHGNDRR